MKENHAKLWTKPFIIIYSEESRRKLNAILFIAALVSAVAIFIPVLLVSNNIKNYYVRKFRIAHIDRLRKASIVPLRNAPRWEIDFRIPEVDDGGDAPAQLTSALAATESPGRPPIAPYSLAGVVRAGSHFLRIFGVVVYDPKTDKFLLHHSDEMRWVPASLQVVGSFKTLAHSLRLLDPGRFNENAPEFAVAISSGDSPCLKWTECLRRQELGCIPKDKEYSPILQFGSNFRRPIMPTMISMPGPHLNHLHCYHYWAMHRRVCDFYLPRGPDNPHGLVFPEHVGAPSWDELTPQVVWRGEDVGYLGKMEPGLRPPDFAEDVVRRVHHASHRDEGHVDKRTVATHALRRVYDELIPRWKGVVLTAEAEREAEAANGPDYGRRRQKRQKRQSHNHQQRRQQLQPYVLPWANMKFDSTHYMGKKTPTAELKDYRQFEEFGIPTVGEEMSLETLGLYRYHIDLAEGGGTARTDTLERLGLPGLLFHHVTPTEDYLHERLVPWVHYVPIKEDLSDLREKFEWAESHPETARQISEHATELARSWGTPEGFASMFEEFFEGPLLRAVEAYRPVERGSDWRETMDKLGGKDMRPILQCGGYDHEDCEQLAEDVQFTRSEIVR